MSAVNDFGIWGKVIFVHPIKKEISFQNSYNNFIKQKWLKEEKYGVFQEINKQIKENKHDQEKMMELQKELLSHSMENMKHSFKPMLITLIPVLIVFNWIRESFSSTIISSSWLWYYLGFALFFSIFFRKLFKLP